jgi:addiction module RelE/StbE family toxin
MARNIEIIFHKNFKKDIQKLKKNEQERFLKRIALFQEDSLSMFLNNHELKWEYAGHRSINITGDIRAIFIMKDQNTALFKKIGSHSELYK